MSNVRPLADQLKKKSPPPPKGWERGLIVDDDGTPRRGLANVMHVLSQHPAWADVLAYDAFLECVVKMQAPPVRPQDGVSATGEWSEADSTRTVGWLATELGFEPSTTHIDQAIVAIAERNVIHPVREYLAGLVWDGVPRLDLMLATHFGATDSAYTRAIGPRWLIAAVARVMRPGCQVDCMPVLEGPQGKGKSTGLEALAGKDWFADTGINIGDKDSYQALRGKWIYEFGELDSIKGREATKVKNFVSARVDTYRPSYGRRTRDFPRQTVFAGTTNEDAYLVDRTGNRRFWPVQCGVIDVAAIRKERDQLWAEAYARYSAGEAWHVDTRELRELCEAEQRDREVEDPWKTLVARWIGEQTARGSIIPAEGVTPTAALEGAIGLVPSAMHHAQVTRIGHVLRSLGWEPRQVRREGERVRIYFPLSQVSQVEADLGCDGDSPENKPDSNLSQVSQVDSHAYAHGENQNARSGLFLGRDGCDSNVGELTVDWEARAADALVELKKACDS